MLNRIAELRMGEVAGRFWNQEAGMWKAVCVFPGGWWPNEWPAKRVGKYPNPALLPLSNWGYLGWLAQRAKGRGGPSFRGQAPSWVPCPFPKPRTPCTQWEAPSSYSPTATLTLAFPITLRALSFLLQPHSLSLLWDKCIWGRWPKLRLLWASVSPTCRMTYSDWSSSFQAFIKSYWSFFFKLGYEEISVNKTDEMEWFWMKGVEVRWVTGGCLSPYLFHCGTSAQSRVQI